MTAYKYGKTQGEIQGMSYSCGEACKSKVLAVVVVVFIKYQQISTERDLLVKCCCLLS